MITASIVSIGDELVKGEILNTNAQYIANNLVNLGFKILFIVDLPDDYDELVKNLKVFIKREGVCIITGGLGGTRDDITRKALAEILNKPLVVEKSASLKLEDWYRERGREYTEIDAMQASVPRGGILLRNKLGLAYGMYIQNNKTHIFSLPGVPHEMKGMFEDEVLRIIQEKKLYDSSYKFEILYFGDIPEYVLDKKIHNILKNYKGVSYGTRTSNGIIRVRLESRGEELNPCVEALKHNLSDYYLYSGFKDISEVVGQILRERNLTLSIAESCTAGFLSKRITDAPGSSDYFVGGLVAYSNEVKEKILKVNKSTLEKYGAVSKQTAAEMADGALELYNSSISIAVTGIAGPSGGTEKKPVGTVYIGIGKMVNGVKDIAVRGFKFNGTRYGIRERTVKVSLVMLLKKLKNMEMKNDPGLID